MKFEDILQEFNIPTAPEGHHHSRLWWVQIDCPFCGKDSKKYHLGYSLEGNFCTCWRCGFHSLIDTLIELTGLSFSKCKKILGSLETTEVRIKEKPKGKLIIPKGVGELRRPHLRYLCERGFNPSEIEKLWKVQGIYIAARLSWRIFIPIFYRGKMVSWTTRSISDSGKVTRYISASLKEESMPHKSLLYGEDYVRQSIIITEGPFDVWRIGPGAVATLGVGYSDDQAFRMTSYPKRAICFDSDKEAQKRARKLCNDLSAFPGETCNIILSGKDAAETNEKEIEELRRRFLE